MTGNLYPGLEIIFSRRAREDSTKQNSEIWAKPDETSHFICAFFSLKITEDMSISKRFMASDFLSTFDNAIMAHNKFFIILTHCSIVDHRA